MSLNKKQKWGIFGLIAALLAFLTGYDPKKPL